MNKHEARWFSLLLNRIETVGFIKILISSRKLWRKFTFNMPRTAVCWSIIIYANNLLVFSLRTFKINKPNWILLPSRCKHNYYNGNRSWLSSLFFASRPYSNWYRILHVQYDILYVSVEHNEFNQPFKSENLFETSTRSRAVSTWTRLVGGMFSFKSANSRHARNCNFSWPIWFVLFA